MPTQAQWLEVNGLRIHLLTAGSSGSPVVLLHGGGIDSAALSWEPTVGLLAEGHRVFAPDLPGYGQSDKPDVVYSVDFFIDFLAQLLDVLELDRVSLIGISMGGAVGLGFTLRYPARVIRLVPVDTYGIMPQAPWHKLSYLYVISPLNELSYWFFRQSRWLARWSLLSYLISSPDQLTEALLDQVYQAARAPDAGKAFISFQRHEILWRGLRTNYTERLHEITVPTLFIHGEQDAGVPIAYVRRAHERVPNSQLYIIPEARHWPQRDKTEEFHRALTDYLRD